jgi:hypothetical protein
MAFYHVAITTVTDRGTHTEHWTTTRQEARCIVARHVASNGLVRNAYSDAEQLFTRDGVAVGYYQIGAA